MTRESSPLSPLVFGSGKGPPSLCTKKKGPKEVAAFSLSPSLSLFFHRCLLLLLLLGHAKPPSPLPSLFFPILPSSALKSLLPCFFLLPLPLPRHSFLPFLLFFGSSLLLLLLLLPFPLYVYASSSRAFDGIIANGEGTEGGRLFGSKEAGGGGEERGGEGGHKKRLEKEKRRRRMGEFHTYHLHPYPYRRTTSTASLRTQFVAVGRAVVIAAETFCLCRKDLSSGERPLIIRTAVVLQQILQVFFFPLSRFLLRSITLPL